MDRFSKQNINKDIAALNNALDEMDLTDVYRTLHPKEAKYTFFSNAYGTFSKIDHMIEHKTSLNKFKKIEIISSIFSDNKGLKLETNLKEKTQNTQNLGQTESCDPGVGATHPAVPEPDQQLPLMGHSLAPTTRLPETPPCRVLSLPSRI